MICKTLNKKWSRTLKASSSKWSRLTIKAYWNSLVQLKILVETATEETNQNLQMRQTEKEKAIGVFQVLKTNVSSSSAASIEEELYTSHTV